MKKILLLLGVLVISANSFSAASIVGGGLNIHAGTSISGSSNYNLGTGSNTVTATGSSTISAGTKFTVPAGGTLDIVTDSGTIQTYTGPTVVTLTSPLSGSVTPATVGSVISSSGSTPSTPATPSTPSTPASPTTPTTPSTPSTPAAPTPSTPTGSVPTFQGARSRVNYDLAKTITANGFKDLEQAKKENGANLNLQYLGGVNSYDYDSRYSSKTNGVVLSGTKNFGNFTMGAGFGYEKSNVKYKNSFDGVKEKLDSYQASLSGKYDFTDNLDVASVLTYGSNKHKYKNYNNIKFDSDVLDFQTRLGYKFRDDSDENTYVKPYVGLGVTSVKEGSFTVGNVNFGKAKRSSGNATTGVYGQTRVGAVDLYGNIEYEQRFSRKSYNGERSISTNGVEVAKLAALDYDQGVFNLGLGAKYNVSDNFNMSAGYELYDTKNSIFKVGLGLKF